MNAPVLSCKGVRVSYGPLCVVDGFTFDFHKGRVYSIIGPNGAGKTTIMNAISGRVSLEAGSIMLEEREISHLRPDRRTYAGLGRSFQISQLFAGFSVLENLRLGALVHLGRSLRFWSAAARDREANATAQAMLERVGLTALRDVPAEKLSHGDQRALEIALALITDPAVVLLDEPLAGVGHQRLEPAIDLLGRAVAGRTVLLIEHNMDVVMRISDEVVVMAQGRILAAGAPEQIRADPRVRAVYLGDET